MVASNKYARSVIKLIFKRGSLTRSEIMHALKMRQNAIVDVCNDLEAQSLIVREEPDRRRNCKLQLSPQCFIFIGLEHHLTGANFVAVDAIGGKLASQSVTLPQEKRLDQLLAATENFISPFKCDSICALGVSDIGLVDPPHETGVYSAHLPGWRDIPLGHAFRERFPYEFFLIDRVDADCFAAHSRNSKTPHIYVNVMPDGIGMSLRDPYNFWQRHMPMAGEIGHLVAVPNGELCRCGNRGCLETVAGVGAVLEKLFKLTGKRLTEAEALELAASGDRLCETVLREAGEQMGSILAKVVGILGVGSITMRGTLCAESGVYFAGLRSALLKEVIYPMNRTLSIDSESRPTENAALGAALFARNEYIDRL